MDSIRIPRESLDTFLRVSRKVLDDINNHDDEDLTRQEVMLNVLLRKKLKEAIFEGEKAIYHNDIKPTTVKPMKTNTQIYNEFKDFSEDKMNFIEGRR